MAARTSLRHRIDERAVAAEQVHILERRRLVEHLVRVEPVDRADRGHLVSPQSSAGRRFDTWLAMGSPLSRSAPACLNPTPCARSRNPIPSGEGRETPSNSIATISELLQPTLS